MRRALPLAVVIACACSATHAPPPEPVSHTTDRPAKRAANALGLDDGVTWSFTGTAALTTKVVAVERDGARTSYRVSGWPQYDASADRITAIVIDDGVVSIDGEPWIRIEPDVESVTCAEVDYCWSVEPDGDGGFDIYFRTRPDVTVYHLVPGRGVTDFTYHHNGTPDDRELHRP